MVTPTINDISDLALCNIVQRLPLRKQIECNLISRKWGDCALRNAKQLVIKIAKDDRHYDRDVDDDDDDDDKPCVSVSATEHGEYMTFPSPTAHVVRHITDLVEQCPLLDTLTLIIRPPFGERGERPQRQRRGALQPVCRELIRDCARQLSRHLCERSALKFCLNIDARFLHHDVDDDDDGGGGGGGGVGGGGGAS